MSESSMYGPNGPVMEPGYEHEAMLYDHAMGCANNPGMCDLDELMGLARGELRLWRLEC